MEDKWTILKVLQWTTSYFTRIGIEQPRSNAEVLLAHILHTERIQLYLRFDQPLSPDELLRFREALRRRATREPTQYITGNQEFWSLEFEVSPAVLIPRPETELLVEKALELLGKTPALVLDLGTGSGAISVALAHERPFCTIVASDSSIAALEIAKRNAVHHKTKHHIHFVASDLFSAFSSDRPFFDIILTNPPYIGESEFTQLAPEVVNHEPEKALRGGGEDGLCTVRKIISEFSPYLKPGGSILIEIGYRQAELLRAELKNNPKISSFEFIRDLSGVLRILHIRNIGR